MIKPVLFSFIQTVTVGFGFSPNLLVINQWLTARGLVLCLDFKTEALTTGRELRPALRMPA